MIRTAYSGNAYSTRTIVDVGDVVRGYPHVLDDEVLGRLGLGLGLGSGLGLGLGVPPCARR